jgi:PD-(D/E)XK nuclease superfamily
VFVWSVVVAIAGILPGQLTDDSGLSKRIIGFAIKVDRHLGSGLMESVYEACLCHVVVHDG